MSEELLHEVKDSVATITFNRPETRNGLTPAYLAWIMRLM
jgi:enoyl-CoA hydratase/carnithine racemase